MEPMNAQDAQERLVGLLRAHREALIAEFIRRAQAAIPAYATVPHAVLVERFSGSTDSIIRCLGERDLSVLSQYLEESTRRRLQNGVTIEAQMLAAQIMETTIRELVSRELAAEPDVLAGALRRVDMFATTSRNIMSRANLAAVLSIPGPSMHAP
jgi:hypothetical protein